MDRFPSRRASIRLISFFAALSLVLGIVAFENYRSAHYAGQQLENTYQRSLEDLTGYVNGLSATLQKAGYAGTAPQLANLSAKLWRESGAAKTALSSLPLGDAHLENLSRFLSQVGDYSMYLTKKMSQGETLSGEERQNLARMEEACLTLAQQLGELERQVTQEGLSVRDLESSLGQNDVALADSAGIMDGFSEMETSFDGMPTLIYDGPFSDHILERTPRLTEKAPLFTQQSALQRAALCAGVMEDQLKFMGDESSNMACFQFSTEEGITMGITKQGGYLAYLSNPRQVGEEALSIDATIKRGRSYLERLGYTSLVSTYYELADGICTINYAFSQNDITYYTDLIKVGVALDNGQVVFCDARGYITNHTDRKLPEPFIAQEEAQKSVNSTLQVRSVSLSCIPTTGLNEVYTYEFKTEAPDGQTVLVYINAQTGAEEQILLLLENENGTLTI